MSNQPSDNSEGAEPASKRTKGDRQLHLAVSGCAHGEMDRIYAKMAEIESREGFKFDLLVCCGDYQAVRNYGDLKHMHCPQKFQRLNTFYKYYSGEKVAPVLTLFIAGNHEASSFMAELPNGGWVAPNIYYMGYASVIQFAGLRIGGLSGIFKGPDYNKGHFERPPYHHGQQISSYHVRSVDTFRLKQLRSIEEQEEKNQLDIMISHDWPVGITNREYGDLNWLLRVKPFFREDIERNQLGNPYTMELLKASILKPRHWFSAHMHVRYTAEVPHGEGVESTKFLALDKPTDNPRRAFVEALHIPVDEDAQMELTYDPAWLAILRSTDALTNPTPRASYMPSRTASSSERWDFRPTADELEEVRRIYDNDFRVPQNFRRTAPPHKPTDNFNLRPEFYYRNPQSAEFADKLGIRDLNALLCEAQPMGIGTAQYLHEIAVNAEPLTNPDEIDLGDDEDNFGDEGFVIDDFSAATAEPAPPDQLAALEDAFRDTEDAQADSTRAEGGTDAPDTDTLEPQNRVKVGERVLKQRPVDIPDEE
ncbi:RNA lariat debranching enzyme [Aphelenchoides avenae]|nr:RNA lariat debranching enzyme [Aphelenchus avenae]